MDADGNHRWSTIIENIDTATPILESGFSRLHEEEAEDNAREVCQLLHAICLVNPTVTLDSSLWPQHFSGLVVVVFWRQQLHDKW